MIILYKKECSVKKCSGKGLAYYCSQTREVRDVATYNLTHRVVTVSGVYCAKN